MSQSSLAGVRAAVLAAYRSGTQPLFHYIVAEVGDCSDADVGRFLAELKRRFSGADAAADAAAASSCMDRLAYGLQAEILANEPDVRASNDSRKRR